VCCCSKAVVYIGVEWDDASRGKHDGSAISVADGVTKVGLVDGFD
jgi:hypothetical protein